MKERWGFKLTVGLPMLETSGRGSVSCWAIMANRFEEKSVRPWCYLLLSVAIVGLAVAEFWRWQSLKVLREQKDAVSEQISVFEAMRFENSNLQNQRDQLQRAIDSFAVANELLRAENQLLRDQTNQLASVKVGYLDAFARNRRLEDKLLSLRSELDAKPRVPRIGAWLGVSIRDPDEPVNDAAIRGGVVVMQVTDRSPADEAKLERGDRLLAIDGEPIGSVDHFKQIMAQKQGGQAIVIDFARDSALQRMALKPRDWPQ
jgi:C-terminal processing protease CtpA/Prc